MTDQSADTILEALEDVLEAERQALLAGDIEGVKRFLDRKESLIEQFAGVTTNKTIKLQNVKTKLERNQELLDQALRGIRSVANRLQALRRVRRSLDTYTADGSKHTVDLTKSSTLEKRA